MNLNAMLRLVSFLLITGCCLTTASAQIRLGYCKEEPTVSSLSHTSTTATISCAMGLSQQLQSPYTDYSLSHLRVAIMEPELLSSLRVWVRESLSDTTTLASAEVDLSTLNAGWNSLELNTSITLDAQKILYCGYSYTQSDRLALAISGKKGTTNAFWIAANENWQDYSKKYAPICIQAELTSPYANAITLDNCQLEHAYVDPLAETKQLQLQFSLTNLGMEPLTSFEVTYQMPESETEKTTLSIAEEPLSYGRNASYNLTLPVPDGLNGADQKLQIGLASPNGVENETDAPTTDTLWFEVGEVLSADNSTPLLIEEFTSLDNGYAPAGQQRLREALSQADRPTILISRHEGYGPNDALHVNGSDYSANFFGEEALSFAPAVWIDRNELPISSTLPVDTLVARIQAIDHPRYASIAFDSIVYNEETKQIEADLEVTLHSITVFRNPHLIVCFTQNNLETPEQKNYYSERYEGTRQSDVLRGFASLPAGGSLLSGVDLEAVAHGHVPVQQYKKQQFKAILTIPSNCSFSAREWHLVAYICDQGYTHKLLGITTSE